MLDGRKTFPIVLAKGPPADGLEEVASAGVNFIKVGPVKGWTDADIAETIGWNRAAAAAGIQTWINLSSLSRARPGGWQEELLRHVVGSLEADPSAAAIGMWKGADEPWRFRARPSSLRFTYCLATGRGKRSWCAGRLPIDRDHLWVTVQAPRAGVWSLRSYSDVTDVHGVNQYPIAIGDPDPNLGEVGSWTNVLRWATPNRAVWTTLQICWSWSYDAAGNVALADVRAGAVHGLRRDPERRPRARVLRRAEPALLGAAGCCGRLELVVLGAGARAARARDRGREPDRAGTR